MSRNEDQRRYWVEKTIVAGRQDRMEGPHALGKALWSPQQSKDGRDIYRAMREVKPGDIIFHFTDNQRIKGLSIVEAQFDSNFKGLQGTEWENRPAYRVALKDYTKLSPAIEREDFLGSSMYKNELKKILDTHSSLFFNRKFELNQGSYLTEAPLELVNLWNHVYKTKTNEYLPLILQSTDVNIQLEHEQSYWIFQANPKSFDLEQDLKSITTQEMLEYNWTVNQYAKRIHTGDTVYLWTSGKDAGVLAVATVTSEPYESTPNANQKFISERKLAEGTQLWVDLRIDHILPKRIKREVLLEHPVLRLMLIIKSPQGTNFPVTKEEAEFLNAMIFDPNALPLPIELTTFDDSRLGLTEVSEPKSNDRNNKPKISINYWLFQIMYDLCPDSWKLMVNAGIAAQQYPVGWINETKNINKLSEMKSGDKIVASFKDHKFAGYGDLTSDFYRGGSSLEAKTIDGRVFNFEERFNCDWNILPINSGKLYIDCSNLKDKFDTRLKLGFCVKKIDEDTFNELKLRLDEAGAHKWNKIYDLTDCRDDTNIEIDLLRKWVLGIERKGQAIIYGPPGTGKTFIAKRLARHLIGGGDGFDEVVQFHPAYSYEDFIQGIRPKNRDDGTLEYKLVPGRFLRFCKKATNRQGICVLIIDEINRANLARVFGELMYLLEYRDGEIPLASSEETDGDLFSVPENVRIIGTMNTADRSIALVDHALRRRFAFLRLQPNYSVLRLYHEREKTGFPIERLIETLRELNRAIADPHYEVGISYFLRKDLKDQIEDIWIMEIEPYLEEYFFNDMDKISDYRWDNIKGSLNL